MANRSNDYVLDELLCYLSNPLFQVPVLSFMENNCLIFDTSTEDSAEYREVHEQYRKLVDALLEAYRSDSGLTHDHIIKAMRDLNAKPELRTIFQELFEQVLAMDDFPCFVHLMINKNLELQKQALMLITMLHGDLPSSLQEAGGDKSQKPPAPSQQEEDEVLRAVLEQSKQEYEAMQKQNKKEEEEFKAVLNISQVESQRLEEAHKQEQEKLSEVLEASLRIGDAPAAGSSAPAAGSPAPATGTPAPTAGTRAGGLASMGPLPALPKESAKPSPAKPAAVPAAAAAHKQKPAAAASGPASKPAPMVAKHDLAPIQGVQDRSNKNAASDWLKAAQDEVKSSDAHSQAVYAAAGLKSPLLFLHIDMLLKKRTQPNITSSHTRANMAGMSEEEYKKRVHFLKQQRDKLMEMKRREREKQLLSAASTQPARPASARAARQALQQPEGAGDSAAQSEEEKKLAMRKAIANRIKSEVMGKK